MNVVVKGIPFTAYTSYENYRGGVNNLCVVRLCDARNAVCAVGTSEKGKEAALKNAKQNLRRTFV